tara:strand:- start:336 stop:668 length:333 start_codon:yes stop_codon:yes gene_type:complete
MMSDSKITQGFKDQITRAKILSEDLVQKLEQYSIVDFYGTYANSHVTMEVMVIVRQIYDILEDIYDVEVIDGFAEPPEMPDLSNTTLLKRGANLRDMLRRGGPTDFDDEL